VSVRLIWEDPNPDLSSPAHHAYKDAARCFNLPGGYPTRFQRLQAKLAEGYFSPSQGCSPHAAAHLLAVFHTLWHQHGCYLFQSVTSLTARWNLIR
jgi:hypothetical protein